MAEAKSQEELAWVESRLGRSTGGTWKGLRLSPTGKLAIHRRISRLNYSRRCAEALAVKAHMKQGLPLAPCMEIGYLVKDAKKWEVDPAKTASEFDAVYYIGLLYKA